jgi:glycosyltransferase involved in cell wall biosynthesis
VNIAVFVKSTTYHHGYGGLETQNKTLCEGLAKRGHRITVFSPKRELDVPSKDENGVSYIFIPSVYRLGLFNNKNNWVNRSYEKFKELHEKEKFDLVLSQSSAGLGVIRRKQELEIKVVSVSHGTILGELKTKFKNITSFKDALRSAPDLIFSMRVFFGRQRDFIHGSNKVIAVSNAVKKALLEETFVDENKVEVVHNGIDPSMFSQRPGKYGKVHLIYLGRVIRSKGVILLVEMIKDLNCILDVVGNGDDMDAMRREAEGLGISQKVVLHGQIPPDQVAGSLLRSDIFVFPTLRMEGLPMVLVEAMFSGLPIVAFDMGGVGDAVEDGVNGFLLKEDDVGGFKARLNELIESADLRFQMSQASIDRAHKEFTVENMAAKYENIFMEVITQ